MCTSKYIRFFSVIFLISFSFNVDAGNSFIRASLVSNSAIGISLLSNSLISKSVFPIKIGERPESITKGNNNDYYVTVMNAKVAGDGEIKRIDAEGNISTFAQGFDEPKGIVFDGTYFYVADLNRVWRIDTKGQAKVFVKASDFPHKALYLNDVALAKDKQGIYVSDMGDVKKMRDQNGQLWPLSSQHAKKIGVLGRIYHITTDGKISEHHKPSKSWLNPNGVGVDNNGKVMIAGFFSGKVSVQHNSLLLPLAGQFRGADAIEQDKHGHYFISSWTQGKVWKVDALTHNVSVLASGFKSAADFYLDEDNKRLLLPDMLSGTINEIKLIAN